MSHDITLLSVPALLGVEVCGDVHVLDIAVFLEGAPDVVRVDSVSEVAHKERNPITVVASIAGVARRGAVAPTTTTAPGGPTARGSTARGRPRSVTSTIASRRRPRASWRGRAAARGAAATTTVTRRGRPPVALLKGRVRGVEYTHGQSKKIARRERRESNELLSGT
jgi:hypothetical protein